MNKNNSIKMADVIPVGDYIESLSYGIEWDKEIEDYVRETGFLPDYYSNTCSTFKEDGNTMIYLVDLWDVGDTRSKTLNDTIFRGYQNLWKWIEGEEFDEREMLEISAIGLGIENYIKIMFMEFPLDGLFMKGQKFFESWIKSPTIIPVTKVSSNIPLSIDITTNSSEIEGNVYLDNFIEIRRYYKRFYDYVGFTYMEVLGLGTILVPSLF